MQGNCKNLFTKEGMPRYRSARQKRVVTPSPFFVIPSPFLSPRAKRGVPRRLYVGVPRHFRASGRQKGDRASGKHGWAVAPSPFFCLPEA